MKCLSVRQPWASLIIHDMKRVEFRTWATPHRGPLLIHAGKARPDADGCREWQADPDGLPLGALLGVAELVDVTPEAGGGYGWIVARPLVFTSPVPAVGRLRLWEPDLTGLPGLRPPTRVVSVRNARGSVIGGPDFVYVGRRMRSGRFADGPDDRFRWGNPWAVKRGKITIAESLRLYREHVTGRPDLVALLPSLRGKVLGCWCCDGCAFAPSPRVCHAQVLAELADGPLGGIPAG